MKHSENENREVERCWVTFNLHFTVSPLLFFRHSLPSQLSYRFAALLLLARAIFFMALFLNAICNDFFLLSDTVILENTMEKIRTEHREEKKNETRVRFAALQPKDKNTVAMAVA